MLSPKASQGFPAALWEYLFFLPQLDFTCPSLCLSSMPEGWIDTKGSVTVC